MERITRVTGVSILVRRWVEYELQLVSRGGTAARNFPSLQHEAEANGVAEEWRVGPRP